MTATLEQLLTEALDALSSAEDLNQLDQVRVQYLGKKGLFTLQMKELGKLSPEQRPAAGQIINQAKNQFQTRLEEHKNSLQNAELEQRLVSESIDVTLPGRGKSIAGLHPVTLTLRRINKIFSSVGFDIVEGPKGLQSANVKVVEE